MYLLYLAFLTISFLFLICSFNFEICVEVSSVACFNALISSLIAWETSDCFVCSLIRRGGEQGKEKQNRRQTYMQMSRLKRDKQVILMMGSFEKGVESILCVCVLSFWLWLWTYLVTASFNARLNSANACIFVIH